MKSKEAMALLKCHASPEKAAASARYFKTGQGEYGEGDTFIGVSMPHLRLIARECKSMSLDQIELLLHSDVHEARMLGLLILVQSLKKCADEHRKSVYEMYLNRTHCVNNWDLVDTSAPSIVGGYLKDKPRKPLMKLAKSKNLWERRIAIVSTQHFIRLEDFDDTLAISQQLIADKEDLIHKACGWMLREVGDRDESTLTDFLDQFAAVMPRTMLRYSIEHLRDAERKHYLMRKQG
jgi:3-methyladenine DNA glycosylase AlkD